MSTISVKGKNILLIGSTGVLGTAYAKMLAKEGANLVLADLKKTNVEELATTLGAKFVHIDLGDESIVRDAIQKAEDMLGHFDGVVSNSAITGEFLLSAGEAFAPFEEYPLDLWKKTLDINLTGTFLIAREAGKRMKAKGRGGSFVTVSSIYGRFAPDHRIYDDQPFKSFAGLSASKAGIIGLTRWLATWWAKDNIRVNCLVPGGVKSKQNEKFMNAYNDRVPLGRMADPDDLTGMLLYLLSDASSYCTGGIYDVDGGLSAW